MDYQNRATACSQSIKIVPSFEECLRAQGVNVELDHDCLVWLEQIKETWKTWKRSDTVEKYIQAVFQSKGDSYRLALLFVVKCEEFKDCKPKSLPYFIIETLHKWSIAREIYPEDPLKLPAFHIALQQRNQQFLVLLVKTYHVSTIKDSVLPIVRDMIKSDNCKQATQIVIALQLYNDVSVEELLFPLILQDKIAVIDEYLTECPSQVNPLLLFLDKMLNKNFNIREYVQNYIEANKVSQVKYEKIHHKPMGKLVARLCNKFNIPIETCQNLSKNRTTSGLRYLIHQKYSEHNVSSEVWEDLVKDSLKQNADAAPEFIDLLAEYDRNEAVKWAKYLNIPEDKLPLILKNVSTENLPTSHDADDWDVEVTTVHNQEYYKLALSDEKITIIDSAEKFYDLLISNLSKCSVVSIDCEWKPSFGATQSQVALVQVATFSEVFLIDTITLNQTQYSSFWYTFHKSFLDNAEIIKVGFGLDQDLREMKASIVGLSNIRVEGEGLLDLGLLWKSLICNGLVLPSNSGNGGSSLSSVVQSCFGLPLEKSEQCSNWELRPLRQTQIKYAALDAFVLLEIYEFLQNLCQGQNINFDEICNDIMSERKKKCSAKKTKVPVTDRIQSSSTTQWKSAGEIKFLLDPQLSSLLPYLSYCGIDTSVMQSSTLWHDVVNLALSEDRVILLPKLKYSPTSSFPQSSILDVGKCSTKEQIYKILNTFNIDIKLDDLMSRCVRCNCKDLKILTAVDITRITAEYEQNPVNSKNYVRDFEEDDIDDYNKFLSDSEDEDLKQVKYKDNYKVKNNCVTSKGVPIEIHNVQKLRASNIPAVLCEVCGKLMSDSDDLTEPIRDLVLEVTKINIQ